MNTPLIQTVAAPGQATVDQPTLFELLHILWFHRLLLFSMAFFIIAIGVIYMSQIVPLYTASSTLLIGAPTSKVVDIEEVLGDDTAILTEVEVLKSRELAKKLVKKLNLVSYEEFNPSLRSPGWLNAINPRPWISALMKKIMGSESGEPTAAPDVEGIEQRETATATNIFLDKLMLSPEKRANVVDISFDSTHPKMAATIVNQLPEVYIIDQLEAKFEATSKATEWLTQRLSEMKEKVEKSEKSVELYREQRGLTEVKGSKIIGSQLMEVNNQLISARAELAQAKVRLQHVKQLKNESGTDIEAAKEVMSSPVIQRLRELEDTLTRKISEMSVNFLPKHKKMQSLNIQLDDVRNKIKLEINRVVVRLRNDVEAAKSKVESITTSLEEMEQQAAVQTKESVRLRSLEREASANRSIFETFLNRFKETTSTVGMLEADARVISMAEVPRGASSPKKGMMLVLIIAGAFFVAIVLVFLMQAFNQGVFTPEQIESKLDLVAIGMIPLISGKKAFDYILEKPHSNFAEALNTLKTSLILCSPDQAVKVLQFTSSVPNEGKSTLSIAFARVLALSGNKVVLLDGDLRRGSLLKKLGISDITSMGLTDLVMARGGSIEEFVIKDEKSGAYIMPNGGAEYINPTDVFSSHRMQAIIDLLKENFDYVIIDTPPVMAVSDARVVAKLVDKTVFVVQWNKTPRKVIMTAAQLLKDGGANIAGCVLNKVDLNRYASFSHGESGYYYTQTRYGEYYTN